MRRFPLLCCVAFAAVLAEARSAVAQISVTTPAVATSVASANDFPTQAFQDPIDMNERTDVGWWLNSVDLPANGWESATFSGGMFTGTVAAGGDPTLWILETAIPNLAATGKTGAVYPINANAYRIFAVRMRLPSTGYGLFAWSTGTMYDAPGMTIAGLGPGNMLQMPTVAGWGIYFVDLAGLTRIIGNEPWSGVKRSLQFYTRTTATGARTIDIDWIRLVDYQPSLYRSITWTGSGAVDIYLDNDSTPTGDPAQTLGLLAAGVSGGTYSLNVGALAPGRYYVAMRRSGTSDAFSYSAGYFEVNAPPTLTVTAPSEEGSSDDFATVHLGNPWDMQDAGDVDATINVAGGGIGRINGAQTEAEASLGNLTGYLGTSSGGAWSADPCNSFSQPSVYLLHPSYRGASRRIDPSKYRILTLEMGLPDKARDLCNGAFARVVWWVNGEAVENFSYGMTLNSRAGANVVNRLNVDMASLPIDPGGPSHSGWVAGTSSSPGISGFRITPHEFYPATPFYITRVKLAAFETANTSYTVRWTTSKKGGTTSVYAGPSKDRSTMTLIGSVAADSISGSLAWDTSGQPEGTQRYVYVEQNDGVNVNGTYAKWPIRIRHAATPTARMVLNRSGLNFGIVNRTTKTPAQTVQLSVLDAPAGQPCWSISSDLWFVQVSPSSGCGSATLTVSLIDREYPPDWNGEYVGSVRITSAGAVNSPQGLLTTVRIQATSAMPLGLVDTPADGSVASGSIAMTGWAVDDIGIARVTICRNPVAGETTPPNPACGPGQIYLGDAVSIDDARPDIETFRPNAPLNYRAGWGFLILTNMLPNQGTGTYVLHARAFDLDGQQSALGSRTIVGQNSTSSAPFGAIDSPGQGETISGTSYANYGWVLSRVRRADPPGGGSVSVVVDGVMRGAPCCWNGRADLSAAFPGYPGVGSALGVFGLNTYALGNGQHTIVWLVTDSAGVTSGIGSRFFSVFNTDAATTAGSVTRPAGPALGLQTADLGGHVSAETIAQRSGFAAPLRPLAPGADLVRRVQAPERGRVELRILADASSRLDAYQVVGRRLRELPVGASFDSDRGALYWQAGPVFTGDYELLVVRTAASGARELIPINVRIGRDWMSQSGFSVNPRTWSFMR